MVEKKRDRTRKKIVDVAFREFAEHGISATSLEMIARQADLVRRTLYYHFDSKEALLDAIIDPHLEKGALDLQELRTRGVQLRTLAEFCFRFWRADPRFPKLYHRLEEENIRRHSEAHAEFLDEFRKAFRVVSENEKLRYGNIDVCVRIVFFYLFPLLGLISEESDPENQFISIFCSTLRSPGA